MRKRIAIVAATVTVLSLIAVAFVIVPAKADNVTDPDAGQVDRPVHYNNTSPSRGTINVSVFGQQIDTDNEADEDNLADKQRAVVVASKVRGALRIAVGVKLQRLISGNWVTSRSAGPTNSFGAETIKVLTSPASAFPTACAAGPGYPYRVVADGKVRWSNNSLQAFQVVSRTWFAEGPAC